MNWRIKLSFFQNAMFLNPILTRSIVVFKNCCHLFDQKLIFVPCPHALLLLYHFLSIRYSKSTCIGLQKWRIKGAFQLEFFNIWGKTKCSLNSSWSFFSFTLNWMLRHFERIFLDMRLRRLRLLWFSWLSNFFDWFLIHSIIISYWIFRTWRLFNVFEDRRLSF